MSKEVFEQLKKSFDYDKFGVNRDTFENIASQWALEQIKEIKNPKEARETFIKLVKEFMDIK